MPSAEAEEGRAQTEENIVQSHMHPTQSGERMFQGLRGVRQAVRFAAIPPRSTSDGRPYRDNNREVLTSLLARVPGEWTNSKRKSSSRR